VRTLFFAEGGGGRRAFTVKLRLQLSLNHEIFGNGKLQLHVIYFKHEEVKFQVPPCSLDIGKDVSEHLFFLLCSWLH